MESRIKRRGIGSDSKDNKATINRLLFLLKNVESLKRKSKTLLEEVSKKNSFAWRVQKALARAALLSGKLKKDDAYKTWEKEYIRNVDLRYQYFMAFRDLHYFDGFAEQTFGPKIKINRIERTKEELDYEKTKYPLFIEAEREFKNSVEKLEQLSNKIDELRKPGHIYTNAANSLIEAIDKYNAGYEKYLRAYLRYNEELGDQK